MRTGVLRVGLALTLSLATAAAAQPVSGSSEFIPLATPCRALDTRVTGPPLAANVPKTIKIGEVTTGGANCGVPLTAVSAAFNFTITEPQGAGFMAAWPSGPLPPTATVNFGPGATVGNAADIRLGFGGTILVQSFVATHLVVDIYGYFINLEELGNGNTALGASALQNNTTGFSNTASGASALQNNTTGFNNTASGSSALQSNTTGGSNTAVGSFALSLNTTGFNNTTIGANALQNKTTGGNNVAIGVNAGSALTSGDNNIYLGSVNSFGSIGSIAAESNTIRLGCTDCFPRPTTFIAGIAGVPVSNSVPVFINTSTGQLGVNLSNPTGFDNTAFGDSALASNTFGGDNTAFGDSALQFNTTGSSNTASGASALQNNTTGFSNTASGVNALQSNTTGGSNTAVGSFALSLNTTGLNNTTIGANALQNKTTGGNNVAIGVNAGSALTSGDNNIYLGSVNSFGSIGSIAAESNTIRLGCISGSISPCSPGPHTSTFIAGIAGVPVSNSVPVLINTSTGQLGTNALQNNTTGFDNTAFGDSALQNNTTGFDNTAFGVSALQTNTTGFNNTASGSSALQNNTTGGSNTASGTSALFSNTTGFNHTASGALALFSNTTGDNNTASGATALFSNTTGRGNTASGSAALRSNTTGTFNTASGVNALFPNTTGNNNTASGAAALFSNTTGRGNTASGSAALRSNTTGFNHTASGAGALRANTTGNNNTALGFNADVASGGLTNAMALGANALVDASNKIRLGNANITVIEGQVAFTFPSDQTTKEHFQPVDGEAVLTKLRALTLTSWNYIGHDPAQFRHYGPMAQEFFAAFGHDGIGTIGTPTTLNVGDVAGIVLSAVQALEQRTAALQAKDAQGERHYGLIAEEVAKVYPELVTRDAHGEVMAVQYHGVIPMLLNEVQHQQRQLVAQAKQLAELKAQNARLQAMIAKQQERDAAVEARLGRLEAAAARAGALASR